MSFNHHPIDSVSMAELTELGMAVHRLWRNLCCILSAPFCFYSLVYCWDYVDFFCADCHSKVACQESERTGSGLVVYEPGGQTQRYHSSTTA